MLGVLRRLRRVGLRPPAALAVAIALGACGSSPAPAPPQQTTHTGNDRLESLYGGAAQLLSSPASTLDTLRRLGVQRIRLDVRWSAVAPDPTLSQPPAGLRPADPGSYPAANWAPFDQVLEAAAARGIAVDVTVTGPGPLWAEQPGDPLQAGEPRGIWRPQPAAFGAFVDAVGTRYSGRYRPPGAASALPRVSFWSIWNEPNYGQALAPQAIDHSTVEVAPSLYRGLLGAAWTALHATGHGHDTILFGETAPRGQTLGNVPGDFGGMVPLRFLRALYCVDSNFAVLRGTAASARGCPATAAASARFRSANPALFDATGFAAHLYPQGAAAPNVRDTSFPDYADFASLPELEQTLDRLQAAYGSSRKLPIYNTEFGYHTNPPEPYAATVQQAAGYLNWAEYISWQTPRLRTYDQYLLADPVAPPGKIGFDTGLEFPDGRPKATFDAYRMPLYLPVTTEPGGRALEVWGNVRPAPDAARQTGTAQQVQIQFSTASGTAFRTLSTVTLPQSTGYFDTLVSFPGAGTVRLAWRYPGGPQVFSRSVELTGK